MCSPWGRSFGIRYVLSFFFVSVCHSSPPTVSTSIFNGLAVIEQQQRLDRCPRTKKAVPSRRKARERVFPLFYSCVDKNVNTFFTDTDIFNATKVSFTADKNEAIEQRETRCIQFTWSHFFVLFFFFFWFLSFHWIKGAFRVRARGLTDRRNRVSFAY